MCSKKFDAGAGQCRLLITSDDTFFMHEKYWPIREFMGDFHRFT
jgi:hypothetical protein